MAKSIAFHSYKGGTGKTTVAANLAVLLARKGYHVCLIELDVYAPSLHAYFEREPTKWLNDFLWSSAEADEVVMDLTPTIIANTSDNNSSVKGKLYVVFCNPKKEEIYKLEGGKMQLLRRFVLLREQIISNYDADYIIIDTSPGIRYWSINALALADTLFLTLKMDSLDIDGTKSMASDIYSSFRNFGANTYLVINKVAEYCTPPSGATTIDFDATPSSLGSSFSSSYNKLLAVKRPEASNYEICDMFSKQVGMNIICTIPCYCDIQFSRREFLSVLKYPDHPFAKRIENLAENIQIKVEQMRKEHDQIL